LFQKETNLAKPKSSPAREVLETIPGVMRAIRRNFRAQRDPDLTLPQFRGLAFVNRSAGCSLLEFAEQVGIEAPSASKLADVLVQRGLISRESDPADRRRVRLNILPEGKKTIAAAYAHTEEFLAEHLAQLSAEEQAALQHAMLILKQAFLTETEKANK
jgi:DNA-binding MarR family transcriptional regulator